MELKKNIKNILMKRQEISFLVEDVKNPNFDEMRKRISDELKKPCENIDVYGIQGKFGRDTFLVKAYVYDSKEELEKIKQLSKTTKQRKAEAQAVEEEKKNAAEAKKSKEEAGKEKEAPAAEAKTE